MIKLIFIIIFNIIILNCTNSDISSKDTSPAKKIKSTLTDEQVYLGINKIKYLTGDFSRDKYLKNYTSPNETRVHSLREDTIEALNKLIKAYDIDREGKDKQHIFIVSAHRNYSDQKMIWEDKFTGKRKMREDVSNKTDEQKVNLILEFSSAPGTSRHHWGTDMDLNSLTNSYFETGNGKFLYSWLLVNASKFGFCQPYNSLSKRENKGYNEEKWHWSYAPISNRLMKDWEISFKNKEISFENKFLGSDILGERPLEYVSKINQDCLNIQ